MLFFALVEQAAIVQRVGVVRTDLDRMIELGQCLLGFSGSHQGLGAHIVGLRIGDVGAGGSGLRSFVAGLRRQRSQIDRAAAERDQSDRCQRA
jgi:hypothetical protein